MSFRVSGEEVATGVADPTNMFVVEGFILGVAFIGAIGYGIYLTMSK